MKAKQQQEKSILAEKLETNKMLKKVKLLQSRETNIKVREENRVKGLIGSNPAAEIKKLAFIKHAEKLESLEKKFKTTAIVTGEPETEIVDDLSISEDDLI